MSKVVYLSGGFDARHEAVNKLGEGMQFLASKSDTTFLSKQGYYEDYHDADTIIVYGLRKVVDRLPDEPRDEFRGDSYWVSDFVVVLDKPDTMLYNVSRMVNIRRAESRWIHGIFAIGTLVASFLITVGVSLVLKQGGLSVVWGFLMAMCVFVALRYEYTVRVAYAGFLGWRYVRKEIKTKRGTLEQYERLVTHLVLCEEPVVADINSHVLRWMHWMI